MKEPLLSLARARELVSGFGGIRVLVLGDVMLDHYVWGEAGRISPEAPVPIVDVLSESLRLGGAANVARNIASLGGMAELVTVVGEDSRADDLRRVLAEEGLPVEGILSDPARPTTLKTRIVASRQQVVRVDRECRDPLAAPVREALLARLFERLPDVKGIIVSDYGKGVIDLALMEALAARAREAGVFLAVDPKESHFFQYRNVSVVTPNVHEASGATRIDIRDPKSLEEAGRRLLSDLDCEGVLITRGPEGMSLFRPDRATVHIPVMAREVFDVTGAGDTVIAAFTLAAAAGASLEEAAVASNAAAAVVVGEVGTAAVTAPEFLMALEAGFPTEARS